MTAPHDQWHDQRHDQRPDRLDDYRPLGRSGLRVSPLALGTMTFGSRWVGADDDTTREVYRAYREAGGNFVDTANTYAEGRSEELLGALLAESRDRDDVVLASKYSGPRFVDGVTLSDPRQRSNGRKNLITSLEGSLGRLGVDHVDLYWLHVWDGWTPAEEVVSAFDEVIRAGKVRAVGLSDVPAWYATKIAMLGGPPVTALQLEYSLVERSIEAEHLPLAAEFGIAVQPWSAIGGGFLSGKYRIEGDRTVGQGRLTDHEATRIRPAQHWATLATVREVAAEVGRTPAQVALRWVISREAVGGTLVGARTPGQLRDTIGALGLELSAEQVNRLTAVSAPTLPFPYGFLAEVNRPLRS